MALSTSNLTIPPAAAINAAAAERTLAGAGARSLIPVTYGVDRQPALLLNVLPKAGDASTLLVQCLWGHALHAVDELRLADQPLPAGSTATHYTGSQTAADANLVAAFAAQGITYTDTLAGYAYSVVSMPTNAFTGSLDFSARLWGRVLYDPQHDKAAPWRNTASAVPGTPGTPPAGWGAGSGTGISQQIVGTGIEDGMPFVDVRWWGTATAVSYPHLRCMPANTVPASAGQVWKGSACMRLVAGSTAGVASCWVSVRAAAGLSELGSSSTGTYAPTVAPLWSQRRISGAWALPASTNNVYLFVGAIVNSGSTVDMTLRIAAPMLWDTASTADPLAWRDNPSLALADWLAHEGYGAGEMVDWTSVPAAAAANDATVGGVEPRRKIGVTLSADGVSASAVSEALRAYAGVWLVPTGSGVKLLPDADAAAVASYSHDDGQIARLDSVSLRDLGNVPTVVEVTYTDTAQVPWREATATARLAGAGTTRPLRVSTVRLPGVQRYSQAYREAVERLNKLNLGDMSFALEVFDAGLRHEPGDIITVSHPIGLASKPMRVTDVEMTAHGRWRLQLAEHDPAAYSTEVQTGPSVPDTNRVAQGGPPPDVGTVSATVGQGIITWSWPEPDLVNVVETRVRTGGTAWVDASPAWSGRANGFLQRVTEEGTYVLRVRHVNAFGVLSSGTASASIEVTEEDLVQSEPGAPGLNATQVRLYRWAIDQPADPSGTSVYNWASAAHGSYTGDADWQTVIPSNPGTAGLSLWVAERPVSAPAGTATTTVLWSGGFTVSRLATNGSQGPQGNPGGSGAPGEPGPPGNAVAVVTLYQWAADGVTPPNPTTATTWNWSTLVHSGSPGGGWSVAVPDNPGLALWKLWAAQQRIIAPAGAAEVSVLWTPGAFTKAVWSGNGGTGPSGANGVRYAVARAYQWATGPAPTAVGSATYTWASGTVSAAPSGAWTLTDSGASSPGATKWQAEVVLTDSATTPTSSVNWGTASVRPVGYAGTNGAKGDTGLPGTQGASARVRYSLATGGVGALASTPATIVVSGDAAPPNSSWGTGTVWVASAPVPAAGQSVWITDGIYNPATNQTTWYAPYLATLRVGSLSAITVNTGNLDVTGSIVMSPTGEVRSSDYSAGVAGWRLGPTGAQMPAANIMGLLTAAQINARGLSILDASGNVVLSANASLNSQVSGLASVVAAASTANWASVSGRPKSYRVGAYGRSSSPPGYLSASVRDADTGVSLHPGLSATRSYFLLAMDRSGTVIHQQTYDVFGQGAVTAGRGAAQLATDLNYICAVAKGAIVVVFTVDEPQGWRNTGGLPAAIKRCGGTDAVFMSPNFRYRSAYILVGVADGGEGSGVEAYAGAVDSDPNAWCEVAFQIVNGALVVSGSTASAREIGAKLSKNAADTLTAPITLSTSGAIQAGNSTNGVVMSQYGLAGYKAGAVTFSINTSGDVVVKGDISGSSGTFGTAAISGTSMTGAGARLTASGAFALGNSSRNIAFNGTDPPRLNGDWVTDSNLGLSGFTASPSFSSVVTGSPGQGISALATITPSGGSSPYTYRWFLTLTQHNGTDSSIAILSSAGNQAWLNSFTGYASQTIAEGEVVCIVTDKNGRTAIATIFMSASYGM